MSYYKLHFAVKETVCYWWWRLFKIIIIIIILIIIIIIIIIIITIISRKKITRGDKYQKSFSLFTRWCRVGFQPYGGSA